MFYYTLGGVTSLIMIVVVTWVYPDEYAFEGVWTYFSIAYLFTWLCLLFSLFLAIRCLVKASHWLLELPFSIRAFARWKYIFPMFICMGSLLISYIYFPHWTLILGSLFTIREGWHSLRKRRAGLKVGEGKKVRSLDEM
ncbi:hypothetical protein [Mechercharimyces sp. CAU 1602]|uniref:hypothetical protein n=1 Tax=Mechercharimyces sp. CAU 1602 TaxID=2973933 RepID=UPI002162A3A6|nr:hypothetical protein [Mechercharimyces sp. CAU 1602]MCS1350955.1 hypothetical protein [Mechercharimyces sp. CAU 1602]